MTTPLRILIVEDSDDDAQLILHQLRSGGYAPTWRRVDTSADMSESLFKEEWDVITCDYRMPHFSAPDALELVKGMGVDTPFIIVSGTIGEDTAVAMMKSGAHDYLMKDKLSRLVVAIEREMGEAKMRHARKQAEIEVVASELRFRRLFESSRDGILIIEAVTGQIMDVNNYLLDLLGFSHDVFLKKKIWEFVISNDIDSAKGILAREFARIDDLCLVSKCGQFVHVELLSNSYLVGEMKVIQCNIRDMTSHLKADEDKQKMYAQLLQAQKMESVGILVGGVAHDFNNTLTVINGYSALMLDEFKPGDQNYKYAASIKQAGEHAATLTRQLLIFSRKQILQKTTLNVNALVKDVVKMLARVIGEDIKINLVLLPEIRNINADIGQIEQVLMNLAINARDAMPNGGTLSIKTENVTISQEYCRTNINAKLGDFVLVSFQDSGIGMNDEVRSHLFEPFYTTKGFGRGTGLGLSVVYGIVKHHEGWIEVCSTPGQGALFSIYLPALNDSVQSAEIKEPLTAEEMKGNGERILIVEDHVEIVKLFSEILRNNRYQVFGATSGREALEMFRRENGRFDLVLTDVVMTDIKGTDVVKELVAINPELKVIFHSGYIDDKSEWQYIKNMGYTFLQKPCGVTKLLTTVRQVLSGKITDLRIS